MGNFVVSNISTVENLVVLVQGLYGVLEYWNVEYILFLNEPPPPVAIMWFRSHIWVILPYLLVQRSPHLIIGGIQGIAHSLGSFCWWNLYPIWLGWELLLMMPDLDGGACIII